MPSFYDFPPDTPSDQFIIEPSSQLSHIHRSPPVTHYNPEDEADLLKPYIVVFRLDPFTTHDGVHGRPVPASTHSHSQPDDTQPVMLEFQLSLGGPPSPTHESEPESEDDPALRTSPPDFDISTKPGPLRYLDGETAPSPTSAESPRTRFETTTWSPAPLFHPLPQPARRQSFSQLDKFSVHRSPVAFHPHPHFNDKDHPFTRVDRTLVPETPLQPSSTLMYPPSLAYHTHHAGSESGSMYAPQSTGEEGQESSNGYRYAYSSSHTPGNDGYSATRASAGSYSYSQDDNRSYYSQPEHSYSFSYARGDTLCQETFATPAQMSFPSRQEEIYPSEHGGSRPGPMSYPTGNSANGHPLGYSGSPSLNLVADDHYRLGSARPYDGDRRDAPLSQNEAQVRGIKFSSSPHQTQPDQIRCLPSPAPYTFHSREPYFQASPRGDDRMTSRGYEQGINRFEQSTSEPRYIPPFSSVFDRRSSLRSERPCSRTSSSAFGQPPSGAFNHISSGTLGLADLERPGSGLLDRPTSVSNPFARPASVASFQTPGTITPMRIFDSPAPIRTQTISPTPSTTLDSVDQCSASCASRSFTPFPPGGMNRSSGGKVHRCTICGRSFPRPSTLATHLNTHTGEKPHLCPVKNCGSRFSVSSNLRRHVKTHKPPGAEPMPRVRRKKTTSARKEPTNRRPRVLQERKNQSWCPESLRGMQNAKNLSSRAPFEMPEGAAPLRAPLPVVRPHGQLGDENYEDRDSFFYAHEMDQIMPYHPLAWGLRPTLPGPLPSHADREARARSAYGYGGSLSELGV